MTNTAQKLTVVRALVVVLKWGLGAAVPLAGIYYVVQHVAKPVQQEIERPNSASLGVDREASGLVQAVQQARLTVAKHDANTDYLNEVAGIPGGAAKPEAAANTGASGRRAGPPPPSTVGLSKTEAVVALLKLGAVIDGVPPRLLIDGKVVRPGDVVYPELGLRFTGLDVAAHAVLFANKSGAVFRRSY